MASVQFINIWDFMIVMPLGPDFAEKLHISTGNLGWIVGSYSTAAAITGIAVAKFLDRFDRRSVLLVNLCGLTLTTLSMVFATSLTQLIAIRAVTGMFAGTMVSTSLAIIADVFPPQRRGEAIGKVFGSFSIASIVGVPLGLEIARHFGLWSPFIVISLMAASTLIAIFALLPHMRHHLDNGIATESLFASLAHNKAAPLALLMTVFGMFGSFLLIPNISAHVQQNMGYPREWLGLLYGSGGVATLFSMRIAGKIVDRAGSAITSMWATILLGIVVFLGFYVQTRMVPVLLVFVLFMVCMSTRNITVNALVSKIPRPNERAGFMSLVSATQNMMSGAGALVATFLLYETPDRRLAGMDTVALLAIAAFGLSTVVMFRIEALVKRGIAH